MHTSTASHECAEVPSLSHARATAPASGEVNTTSLIKSLRKDVQRVEDENTRLKQENETLRHKNRYSSEDRELDNARPMQMSKS